MPLKFVMKGYKGKTVYGAYARGELEIKGHFHAQGVQPVGDDGAPEWVAEIFKNMPHIKNIAVSGEEGSALWTRRST